MFPARDVGCAVGAVTVADGEVYDLTIQFGGAEDKVEISEGVEISKIGTVRADLFIIFTPHYFCSTQCIFDGLTQQPGKCHAEEFVADEIQCAHRFFFHRIDQTYPVDELAFA